jgi:hypothetical protein
MVYDSVIRGGYAIWTRAIRGRGNLSSMGTSAAAAMGRRDGNCRFCRALLSGPT